MSLYALARCFYPGGSYASRNQPGYGLENFVCDLTRPLAHNGELNRALPFARAALLGFALSMSFFYWAYSYRFARPLALRACALLGFIGVVCLSFMPSSEVGVAGHAAAVFGSVLPALGAALAIELDAFSARPPLLKTAAFGLLSLALSGLSAGLYLYASLSGAQVPLLAPVQQIAVISVVLWLWIATWELRMRVYARAESRA